MPISTIYKGTIVARRDQPAQLGIVAHVVRGVIMFVYWRERLPSYEHICDLVIQPKVSVGNKKPRSAAKNSSKPRRMSRGCGRSLRAKAQPKP